MKLTGFLLIAAGLIALVYGGFTYTTHKKALDLGPIEVQKEEQHSVPMPPLLGIAGILAGGALVYAGSRKGSA